MGDVINLNKVRKAREKAATASAAQSNRAKHGRTKAERTIEKALSEKAEVSLSGHKRSKAPADKESRD